MTEAKEMSMKKIRVTLEFDLVDLDDETRKEGAFEGELPSVDEVEPFGFGEMVAEHMEYANEVIWCGSNLYAKIESVAVVSAEEVSEQANV